MMDRVVEGSLTPRSFFQAKTYRFLLDSSGTQDEQDDGRLSIFSLICSSWIRSKIPEAGEECLDEC